MPIINPRIVSSALLSAMLFGAPASGFTQSAPKAPCSDAAYRQLDFWVGSWNLWFDQGEGKARGIAHNTITKDALGQCVITENFTMDTYKGTSISIFHNKIDKWRQTWVDNGGNYFDLVGGPAPKDSDYDFGLELVHPEGIKAPFLRMIWQIKDKDNLVWRWQEHQAGETKWQDKWVLHYVREDKLPIPPHATEANANNPQ